MHANINTPTAPQIQPPVLCTIELAEGEIGSSMESAALPVYAFEAVLDRIKAEHIRAGGLGYNKVWAVIQQGDNRLSMRLDIDAEHPTRVKAILRERIAGAEEWMSQGSGRCDPMLSAYRAVLSALE